MNKYFYDAEVRYSDEQTEVMAERAEYGANDLEQFIADIIQLNKEIGNEGDEAVQKLEAGEYEVELDSDGEDNYITVVVKLEV